MIDKPVYRYGSLEAPQLVKLFRQPGVYAPSSDDYTQPVELQRFTDAALASPYFYFLGRDARWEAFIFAMNHNRTTFQGHFAVAEGHRENVAKRTAEAGKWLFENTECRSIVAFIRKENGPARSIMGQIGMSRIGVLKESVLFNKEYHDEVVYQCTVDDYNRLWGEELGRVER